MVGSTDEAVQDTVDVRRVDVREVWRGKRTVGLLTAIEYQTLASCEAEQKTMSLLSYLGVALIGSTH